MLYPHIFEIDFDFITVSVRLSLEDDLSELQFVGSRRSRTQFFESKYPRTEFDCGSYRISSLDNMEEYTTEFNIEYNSIKPYFI